MNQPNPSQISAREFIAERVYLYARAAWPRQFLDNVEVSGPYLAHSAEQAVLTITTWATSGRIKDRERTITVEYPDGVWQMWKQKFAPRWFATRYPVRMKSETHTVEINHYFVCPHVHVPADSTLHLKFMATGQPIASQMGDIQ